VIGGNNRIRHRNGGNYIFEVDFTGGSKSNLHAPGSSTPTTSDDSTTRQEKK
jgi:hypothetical protein